MSIRNRICKSSEKSNRNKFRPTVDALDQRCLLSTVQPVADVTLNNGLLTIDASKISANAWITLTNDSSKPGGIDVYTGVGGQYNPLPNPEFDGVNSVRIIGTPGGYDSIANYADKVLQAFEPGGNGSFANYSTIRASEWDLVGDLNSVYGVGTAYGFQSTDVNRTPSQLSTHTNHKFLVTSSDGNVANPTFGSLPWYSSWSNWFRDSQSNQIQFSNSVTGVIQPTSSISLTNSVNIIGNGTSVTKLNGRNIVQGFQVSNGAAVAFENLSMENFSATWAQGNPNGSAINFTNGSSGAVIGCYFGGCGAEGCGTIAVSPGSAGLWITDNTFNWNSCGGIGAAVCSSSPVIAQGNTFTNNTAFAGGWYNGGTIALHGQYYDNGGNRFINSTLPNVLYY